MFWDFFASVCFEEAGDINMESQNNGSYGENDGLGLYFPVFGLNTEIYAANLRIQSEYGKIRTRKKPVFGHFSRSEGLNARVYWLLPGYSP